MGATLELQELLKSRTGVLNNILHNIRAWDGTPESGVSIIEQNQLEIERIEKINNTIQSFSDKNNDDVSYVKQLELIISEQKQFTVSMKTEQNIILSNIRQLNKKNEVVNNYITTNRESVFVDKDFK
ncbi:hypothetical protein GC105_03150 [Alkalibaculum sp. M08DMB]|uniref:Flagellar protein FliT n=1 Tax=Alkalibaculum sporogenes TaxID=2655001 RepID=A0A6A7K6E8_9FIRM|nr:hypothetical protein [Alkalibaculum sporogenes]MPW24787.1 hypothetical protein [Alkalibaculum sporogenes]